MASHVGGRMAALCDFDGAETVNKRSRGISIVAAAGYAKTFRH